MNKQMSPESIGIEAIAILPWQNSRLSVFRVRHHQKVRQPAAGPARLEPFAQTIERKDQVTGDRVRIAEQSRRSGFVPRRSGSSLTLNGRNLNGP
jgi:hypothetical protein